MWVENNCMAFSPPMLTTERWRDYSEQGPTDMAMNFQQQDTYLFGRMR